MPLDNQDVSQRIDMILRIGFGAKPQGEYPDGSSLNKSQRFADASLTLLATFAHSIRQINADLTLSPIGRGQKLTKLGQENLTKLDALRDQENVLPAIKRKLSNAETIIAGAISFPDRDDVAATLREIETRSWLYEISDAARYDLLRKVVELRDFATLAAIVNAPAIRPMFSNPQHVADALSEIAETLVPVAVKDRDEAREAIEAIDMIRKDMRGMIAGATGVELDPPRRGLAPAANARPLEGASA